MAEAEGGRNGRLSDIFTRNKKLTLLTFIFKGSKNNTGSPAYTHTVAHTRWTWTMDFQFEPCSAECKLEASSHLSNTLFFHISFFFSFVRLFVSALAWRDSNREAQYPINIYFRLIKQISRVHGIFRNNLIP